MLVPGKRASAALFRIHFAEFCLPLEVGILGKPCLYMVLGLQLWEGHTHSMREGGHMHRASQISRINPGEPQSERGHGHPAPTSVSSTRKSTGLVSHLLLCS